MQDGHGKSGESDVSVLSATPTSPPTCAQFNIFPRFCSTPNYHMHEIRDETYALQPSYNSVDSLINESLPSSTCNNYEYFRGREESLSLLYDESFESIGISQQNSEEDASIVVEGTRNAVAINTNSRCYKCCSCNCISKFSDHKVGELRSFFHSKTSSEQNQFLLNSFQLISDGGSIHHTMENLFIH